MTVSADELNHQLDANQPEVRQGQVWRCDSSKQYVAYPYEIRIISLYPFTKPDDGRIWVVERHPGSLQKMWRIPELSLRLLYDLVEDEPVGMRVLVCGSRDWGDLQTILKRLKQLPSDAVVIHGAASRKIDGVEQSADMIADEVAYWHLGLKTERYPADWSCGKRAGFDRNLQMLDTNPDLVIAFQRNRSRGTQHTIDNARERGIPVEVITKTMAPA
jgi:hypothetical protein